MGRPTKPPSSRKGTTRRAFLRQSGGGAAALAALPLVGTAASADKAPFRHGVASGDPLADRVILWTRITPSSPRQTVQVRWEIATDPYSSRPVARGIVRTDERRDHTVKVDVTGLRPATTYYYRFINEGVASPIGRTRTLPAGATPRVRIAVASCSNHAAGYFNAYRRIAERADLDLVLHLGDYLYEYGADEYGSLRVPDPTHEMVVLSDYRRRHAQYKSDPDLQELHRQHPMVAIWDDHEIANDAWRDGAQNHSEGTEGRWPDRVNMGLQAYYEWMPVRQPDASQPRRNQRSFRIGDLIDLVMLEQRLGARSQQLPATIPTPFGNGFVQAGAFADPSRTLLGSEQEAWLAERLRSSKARWKFVGQGVMFAQLKLVGAPLAGGGGVFLNTDQWDGYQPARDRVYSVIEGDSNHPPVNDVVVLTGDIHSSWASDLSRDPNNPNVAAGGYDPASGSGSRAVEFVGTSISSPGVNDPNNGIAMQLRTINPHFKHIELNQRGYMLLDATPERVVCEWWYVETVQVRSPLQSFGTAFEVRAGMNRLAPAAQTTAPAAPPALAP